MSEVQFIKHSSQCGKIIAFIDVNTSASEYHDFCLKEKGWAVDIMVANQKKEEEIAAQQRKLAEERGEVDC